MRCGVAEAVGVRGHRYLVEIFFALALVQIYVIDFTGDQSCDLWR